MSVIIEMMMSDPDVWMYMVDKGDRKQPRYDRNYALTILASLKGDYVK